MSEDAQKKAGQSIAGDMDPKYKKFLDDIVSLIDRKEISLADPRSFLKVDVYDALDEKWRDKTDLALLNVFDQLKLVVDFYKSRATPDSSPQLETMVEELWHMKQMIETHHDVFKF